jgi:2-hydroxy-3-keto-5-methylthiopentenyl-1-phosphate phosphatase
VSVSDSKAPLPDGKMSGRRPVIFCDFDGTITDNDNIVEIMKHFRPPGYEELIGRIVRRELSVREGVGKLFSLLPSRLKPEIEEFTLKQAKIRSGFRDLLDFCRKRDIEFFVTSGGIDFFVYPVLAPFEIPPDHIYCNGSDFSGEHVRITWPHACDEHCSNDCGMCKTAIIRRFPQDRYFRILIGDSITDFEGAKLADIVFARSHLIGLCEELSLPFYPFGTFDDVLDRLEEIVPPTQPSGGIIHE